MIIPLFSNIMLLIKFQAGIDTGSVHMYLANNSEASSAHYDYYVVSTPNSAGQIHLTREIFGNTFVYGRVETAQDATVTINATLGSKCVA